jgi:signal peptidase I
MKPTYIPKVIKSLKIIGNVFFYLVIVFLIVFSFANMKVKSENNIANVFGIGFLSVQSNSMAGQGSDNFSQGDMVFTKMLNAQSRENLAIGDIVTYFDMSIKQFNTHRIIEIYTIQGETFLITRGDNTPGQDQPIHISEAISVYQSSLSGLGNALDYLQTSAGFAIFVILPVILILIFEGIILGRNILQVNKNKMEEKLSLEKEKAALDLEAEKEKIRQQILAELSQKQTTKE